MQCNRRCLGDTVRGHIVARIPAFAFEHTPMGRRQLLFACIPWVLFSLYWEATAMNLAAVAVSEMA